MISKLRRTTTLVLLAALAATPAAVAQPGAANLGGGGPDRVPAKVERVLGGKVTALANGLYRVRSKLGYSFTTHGPDFRHDIAGPFGDLDEAIAVADERPIACATDYYQEVLYAYPSSGSNDLATHEEAIRAQIRTNNALLNADSLASGGPQADYKVRCDAGVIRVTAFQVPSADSTATFTEVVTAAKAAGFGEQVSGVHQDSNVDYTIFYDGPGNAGACGVGYLYGDDRPIADNFNNNPAGVEAGYGVSFDGCWFGRTSIHENAHNQGAVQAGAPNSTGSGGHCNEQDDVMCYVDGGDQNQVMVACPVNPGVLHFDCAYDTYFDSAPEGGEWLATNWNIGHTRNRFVQFGGPDVTAPDTTVSGGPSGPTGDNTPNFTFTSTELNSNFECSFDDPTPTDPCIGARGTHTPSGPLADGPHTFYVRAVDPATNPDSSPASRSFSIDTQGPDTAIDSAPPATVTTSSTSVSFSSPEPGVSFDCRLDGSGYSPCTSPRALTGLTEGNHTFFVRAKDGLGNADASPAATTFTVDFPNSLPADPPASDTTPPETTIDSGPAKVKKGKNATVSFSSSESGSSFSCRLDSGGFEPCNSPMMVVKPRKGRHVLEVRAADAAGNADPTPAQHRFTVRKKKRRR